MYNRAKERSTRAKAWKFRQEKELIHLQYPSCRGTFTDCPPEDEFKAAVEKDKSSPPERCKQCPVFKDSKFYKPTVSAERMALWEKLREKSKK